MISGKKTDIEIGLMPVDDIMKSIFIDEAKSISIDVTEMGIDSLIESEVIRQIPIVKTVYSLSKVSFAIKEKNLLIKLILFIQALNQGNADPKEIEKRKKAADNNKKWLKKEVELITTHLDRLDEVEKAEITAAFYLEYINQKISWDEYREILAIIERIFHQDFIQLLDLHDALFQEEKAEKYVEDGFSGVVIKNIRELNCERLLAVGLVKAKRSPVSNGIRTEYNLSWLGKKFSEVLAGVYYNVN